MQTRHFDYIIAGGGGAGLSLAYRLALSPTLRHRRVLLLDRVAKVQNDRTWSFWEESPGLFDDIVQQRWPYLQVHQGDDYAQRLSIAPFSYKMIRSLDFYRRVQEQLATTEFVQLQTDITAIIPEGERARVQTPDGDFTADWCFSSIPHTHIDRSKVNYLDQHFRGWYIETEQPAFEVEVAHFMDFRTPQFVGETRFLYVLPTSEREALVEVAIFSNQHLAVADYDHLIEQYLTAHWPQLGQYRIVETEMGNIPMTDYPFARQRGRVVWLGMAGGDTRASTGYTFRNIQLRLDALVARLESGQAPTLPYSWAEQRHRVYDSTLLGILQRGELAGDVLFAKLFQRNPPQRLLRFLNGESSLVEELALMQTVPLPTFSYGMLRELRRWASR